MLCEGHACIDLLASVLFYHFDDLGDHLLLILGVALVVGAFVGELAVDRVALRQVRVQPHLDLPVPVHAHHVLARLEIAHPEEYLLETVESAQEDVQVLGVGDIFDVAEPNWNVLDIDACAVIGVAEFLDFFGVDEFGVDDGVLPLPPFKELQVLFVFCGVVEVNLVFLDLFAGEVVAVEVAESKLGT